MKEVKETFDLPFQVENLIMNMLDKNEKPHIRSNYRMRLESIRDTIDLSLKKFDGDMFSFQPKRKSR